MFKILLMSFLSLAQVTNSNLKLDPNKPMKIDYESKSWNKDPKAIDVSSIILRDSGSGRLARIEMQETGPDTGMFVGNYQIGFRPDADILPEIYVVPQKMLESGEQLRKIDLLIRDGTLLRKPFFLRQMSRSLQAISVYDTREQALQAFQEFKVNKPVVDRAALEAFERAAQASEKARLAALENAQAQERLQMELLEKKKMEELKKKQAAMDQAEKNRRKKQAQELSNEAMALYKKENYKEAEEKFAKAVELDPDNAAAYFPFGVTLYKNEKFNKSLVALDMATGPDVNATERDYFKSLDYMKLKEFDSAYKGFMSIKEKKDKTLSASSSFFAGVIDFQKEKYDDAQKNFEFTIDNSTDPKMDQQAEAYIEQIANIKNFLEQQKKKLLITFNLGLQYDSNILNEANANSQTNKAGIRGAYSGSFEYRPVYSQNHEFSVLLSYSDLYSWDTSFQAKPEFQQTDPLSLGLSAPYKYKGMVWGKPYLGAFTAGYDNTYMNVDATKDGIQKREQITGSGYVKADQTFVMNDDYFATYSLELRSDSSKIEAPDDDKQSGNKITLSTAQTVFKNKKKTEAQIYDASFTMNNAVGKNQKFNRIDLGISYTWPWLTEMTWNGRLGIFSSPYAESVLGRSDNGLMATIGARKILSDTWAAVGTLMYSKNNSNVEANVYDKYMLMLGVSYAGAF